LSVGTPTDVKSTTIENPVYQVAIVETVPGDEIPAIVAPTVKDVVSDYFKDIPILVKVARCESQFRQVDSSGKTLRGIENGADVGVMQINEKYHLDRSKKLGLDIYTLEGNLAYGKVLYDEQGTAPWMASSPCWSK
jgi:hypothetical protein